MAKVIEDPVIISQLDSFESKASLHFNSGNDHIFYHQIIGKRVYIGVCDPNYKDYWHILVGTNNFAIRGGTKDTYYVGKETFLTHLRQNWPKHFEWFLWNQELL